MHPNFFSRLLSELKARGVQIRPEVLSEAIHETEAFLYEGPEYFEKFWAAFPRQRRKDKIKCRKKWILHQFDQEASVIIADVNRRKAYDFEWNMGFAPMPATYLNNRRWEEDLILPDTRSDLKRFKDERGRSWSGPLPDHLKEEQADWVDTFAPEGGWQ